MIDVYNTEVERQRDYKKVVNDPKKIKWSSGLESKFNVPLKTKFSQDCFRTVMYRPFQKSNLYFDPFLIDRPGQMPKIFPKFDTPNLVIAMNGAGSMKAFSALMINCVPDLKSYQRANASPSNFTKPLKLGMVRSNLKPRIIPRVTASLIKGLPISKPPTQTSHSPKKICFITLTDCSIRPSIATVSKITYPENYRVFLPSRPLPTFRRLAVRDANLATSMSIMKTPRCMMV